MGAEVAVLVHGEPLAQVPSANFRFNSPDLNGDGRIDLVEVRRFSGTYHGQYDYAADFVWDGKINMADLAILVQHCGHHE